MARSRIPAGKALKDTPRAADRRSKPGAREVLELAAGRLARAKFAYTTRRVAMESVATLLPAARHLKTGDVVLARVEKLGQHDHLELPNGRRALLYRGDEIVVSFGNRYAPDQFEAVVPETLAACHLVAAGGIAARMLHKHSRMHNPTEILPLGLLGDAEGRRVNLSRWGLARSRPDPAAPRPRVVVVAGTSMNSGKTTTISCLTRGLIGLGYRVAAAKLTGTGAGGDHWHMADAGADPAMDFIDAGYASTYLLPGRELEEVVGTQLAHLFRSGADFVLLEISDGVLEPETARLLVSPAFRPFFDVIVFTAGDSMGAAAGAAWLRERRLPVIGISGLLTASPLAMREALAAAEIPVYTSESFIRPEIAAQIVKCLAAKQAGPPGRKPGPGIRPVPPRRP